MIARPTPIGNIWRASSLAWFMSFALLLCLYWPVLDELGLDNSWISSAILPWLGGTALLWAVGMYWQERERRVVLVAAIGTLFGLLPLLVMCVALGWSFFILVPSDQSSVALTWGGLLATTVWWCQREVRSYAKRIVEKRFIEREFSLESERIVLRRPPKIDLEPEPINNTTLLGRIYNKVGPRLVLIVPMAYPLQRLLADTGGIEFVLFLISLLGTPFAIHALGRFSCGAYLYGYKVWQLEKRHCKPVVFEHA